MKTKKKYLIIIMLLAMLILIIKPTISQAALQSNGGTEKKYLINDWMLKIREMQKSGGTLGLSDTINANLTSTNTNLDIHLQKNTEYGAMAILSASSYGKPNKIGNGETTTGNKTGIVIKQNGEITAAGLEGISSNSTNWKNAVGRYKNIYEETYKAKIGDAIEETKGWHIVTTNSSNWINSTYQVLHRGKTDSGESSIFSYNQTRSSGSTYTKPARAVIVVGTGI